MTLTTAHARTLADELLHAATAIDAFLDAEWESITRPQYEAMNESGRTLLRVSSFCTTEAVGLSLTEMEETADSLTAVIVDANGTIKSLNEARLGIQISAGLADLAAGIIARNPKSVGKAAKNLRKLLKD